MANGKRILFHREKFQHKVRRIRVTRLRSFWGIIIMRKLALLVAAALLVSAPMLTTATTDSFAAAKAKAKSSAPQNDGFWMALGDNMSGKSVEVKSGKGKGGKKGGMRGKSAKKGGMGGMGGGGMGGMGGSKKK